MWAGRCISTTWKARARPTSTARRTLTAPTTSKRFPRINWNWHCGWKATVWAIWSARWTSKNWPTSATWCATNGGSGENSPYGLVEEGLFHLLFPKEHPYYASVIGSHADVEAAKLEDVREFFRQYYTPNNATMAIVGDFDPAKIKALVEKYFGSIPKGPEVPKITASTPPITSERRAVVTDQVELPRVYMGWITPPVFHEGRCGVRFVFADPGRRQEQPLVQKPGV